MPDERDRGGGRGEGERGREGGEGEREGAIPKRGRGSHITLHISTN